LKRHENQRVTDRKRAHIHRCDVVHGMIDGYTDETWPSEAHTTMDTLIIAQMPTLLRSVDRRRSLQRLCGLGEVAVMECLSFAHLMYIYSVCLISLMYIECVCLKYVVCMYIACVYMYASQLDLMLLCMSNRHDGF
jgi:hypothetical protein